jgi:hypothetical protein
MLSPSKRIPAPSFEIAKAADGPERSFFLVLAAKAARGALLLGWLLPGSAAASSTEAPASGPCQGEPVLLSVAGSHPGSTQFPRRLGSWRLPVRWDSPELLTDARLEARLVVSAAGADLPAVPSLEISFRFSGRDSWGLPFDLRLLEFEWEDAAGFHTRVLDWSNDCRETGLTLFPGGTYREELLLPDAAGGGSGRIKSVRIRLWGSR